jgi:hypothetical protein
MRCSDNNRNNLCDIKIFYHTDFVYHSDAYRSVSMFHTNFFYSRHMGTYLLKT